MPFLCVCLCVCRHSICCLNEWNIVSDHANGCVPVVCISNEMFVRSKHGTNFIAFIYLVIIVPVRCHFHRYCHHHHHHRCPVKNYNNNSNRMQSSVGNIIFNAYVISHSFQANKNFDHILNNRELICLLINVCHGPYVCICVNILEISRFA